MPNLKSYHRPQTVAEALKLLERPSTIILAGGTQLVARLDESIEELVDLQAVGLDQITVREETITLGAMVRLQTIVEHNDAPALVRELARREGPNTFRYAGAIGGVIATADWESELYAALLVHETAVTVQTTTGAHTAPLADGVPQGLITGVTIKRGGETAVERVARTPADKPIVAVVGRKNNDGNLLLAVCGVAERPLLVAPDAIDTLTPPADFRGSPEYRRQMAHLLSQRVLNELNFTQS